MYNAGELIVYGSTGVCRIVEIAPMNRPNMSKDTLYYTLEPLYQDGIIYVPVDNNKVFMRDVISREQAEQIIDMIPKIEEAYKTSDKNVTDNFKEAFASHNCTDLVELIVSIYNKKQYVQAHHRQLGQMDVRYMKRAEELLYGEFAIALNIPKEKVQSYIGKRIEEMKENEPKE
ncbi:MAG: CarD family transcriptional regulator [Oscillospiraceae bacterium]|nr:CarD family transcriptional regulator [Oscillospiraceae bacterium]